MTQQVKVSSFYGNAIARPFVLLGENGETIKDRVEAPKVNDALIKWANRVPFKLGGLLVKPTWDGEEPPKAAPTDFALFMEERMEDILADNPALTDLSDRPALLAVASDFWHNKLTDAERKEYRTRSKAEKEKQQQTIADMEEADPAFKAYREKESVYKRAMTAIHSAARVATGPLWRMQRRLSSSFKSPTKAVAGKKSAMDVDTDNDAQVVEVQKKKHRKRIHKGLKNHIKKRAGKKLGLRSNRSKALEATKQHQEAAAGTSKVSKKGKSAVSAPGVAPAAVDVVVNKGSKKTRSKRKPESEPEGPQLRRPRK